MCETATVFSKRIGSGGEVNELSERIYELRTKTWSKIGFDTNNLDFTQRYDALIEQALLAERRLAMEAFEGIVKRERSVPQKACCVETCDEILYELRAAAETEKQA